MNKRGKLGSVVETFNPTFSERWEQQPTTGAPPPGLCSAACSSLMDLLYSFGGWDGRKNHNSLHCLSTSVREWRELGESNPQDGPMEKHGCQMVTFNNDALALFGGYGIPRGTSQPGSSFIMNEEFSDGSGWTNELHLFNVNEGNVGIHNHYYSYCRAGVSLLLTTHCMCLSPNKNIEQMQKMSTEHVVT